ncbi:MAG: peptidoglycan-binding protein [Alphaproteobacteria bacterium]|nr:peptidoglycan-binding protein [Alphaproteobacteria bacterium]
MALTYFWNHTLFKGFALCYSFPLFVQLVGAEVRVPPDYDAYKIADNLSEYFDHISKHTVDSHSDVYRVIPVQMALEQLDYDIGQCGVDGMPGYDFSSAVTEFQKDHRLEITGTATLETLAKLFGEMKSNADALSYMEEHLITPYQNQETSMFMDSVDDIFSATHGISLLFRPDVAWAALNETIDNKVRKNAAEKIYSGCSNFHRRDAFRHAASTVAIINSSLYGTEATVVVMDIEEKVNFNSLPSVLMDMFNHRIAADMVSKMTINGQEIKDPNSFLIEAVNSGSFITYPFPLVPKKNLPLSDSIVAVGP